MKGIHGTCMELARKIEREGFSVSEGRIGHGIYFWAYDGVNFEPFAKDLALSWCFGKKKKGQYEVQCDSCAAIFAEIRPTESFLDLEEPGLREKFVLFYNKRLNGSKMQPTKTAIYDLFVKLFEEEHANSVDVIHIRVAPPDRNYYKPMIPIDVTGSPRCYVVRNKHCISVAKIET